MFEGGVLFEREVVFIGGGMFLFERKWFLSERVCFLSEKVFESVLFLSERG